MGSAKDGGRAGSGQKRRYVDPSSPRLRVVTRDSWRGSRGPLWSATGGLGLGVSQSESPRRLKDFAQAWLLIKRVSGGGHAIMPSHHARASLPNTLLPWDDLAC